MFTRKLLGGAALAALLLAGSAASGQAKELTSIGATLGSLGNPFFLQIVKGAEKKAKEINGDKVKVTAVSADYDLNKQFTQIDNFIASGVDIILLNAVDPTAIAPAVKRAQDAGIVVMAVDVAAAGADGTVMTDNVMAGAESCQYIVEKLEGEGNVIIVNGPPVSAIVDRVKGCHDVLDKNTGIKVLSDNQNGKGSREGGLEVTSGLLTAFDQVDAIFGINDPTSIGADLAAKQQGRTDLFITSVDGAPDIANQLKDGSSLILASASQDPFTMAERAIEIGYGIMNGKKPDNPIVLLPPELVTRDNVGAYKGWTKE
ncbi:monosaccharide ABC transporter substrate-binding protein, CUT2 family [Arboricoccus pini]|uniref:Monosaccharide ABC transporter substrate-binding protein, CUT2 family n=1 Tax=Arboricoccus pini TaxID=1963835 RepID=A0A212PVV5_9PROT|nr:ABC transporter substrate-binding protein [Arboricoccus pini]SNB51095.1 monosaccharide ABC transporter substrate-binding protein, CUT2 family [Arboricoccus pini]